MTQGAMASGVDAGQNACSEQGSAALTIPHQSTNINAKRQRKNGVQRTNTVVGVTNQARRVLEELLAREHHPNAPVKKEKPLSAPTPRLNVEVEVRNLMRRGGPTDDVTSPLSDGDPEGSNGTYKRRPSHGISTVLGDSSPSPVEIRRTEEVSARKKKSFFVRAKERLRETIRRQDRKPLTPTDERTDTETRVKYKKEKKRTWSWSLKKKKGRKETEEEEEEEERKENVFEKQRRDDGAFRSIEKESDQLHPTRTQTSSSRTSLPSERLSSVNAGQGAVPARSRSADDTRLRPLRPDEDAILSLCLSNASDSIPAALGTSRTLPMPLSVKSGNHSLRKSLHLEGLISNRPNEPLIHAPLAVPEDSQVTPDEEDFIDGLEPGAVAMAAEAAWNDRPLLHATSKPFNEKSEEERNELFGRIAEQLDVIGDSYCFGATATAKSKEGSSTDGPPNSQIRRAPSTSSLSDMAGVVSDLVLNTTYDAFQRVVNRTIGSEPGIEQIAAMFRITRNAVQLAGLGTSAAGKIKEMSIKYFRDHFAGWMVGEGGWESVVEDSATDMELD